MLAYKRRLVQYMTYKRGRSIRFFIYIRKCGMGLFREPLHLFHEPVFWSPGSWIQVDEKRAIPTTISIYHFLG